MIDTKNKIIDGQTRYVLEIISSGDLSPLNGYKIRNCCLIMQTETNFDEVVEFENCTPSTNLILGAKVKADAKTLKFNNRAVMPTERETWLDNEKDIVDSVVLTIDKMARHEDIDARKYLATALKRRAL